MPKERNQEIAPEVQDIGKKADPVTLACLP